MLLSLFGFDSYLAINPQVTRYDPSRIPSYVVSGIGFLGAGTIMTHGATVKGLTTAASIWTIAGLGLVVGVGMYFESVLVTVIIITTLLFLDKLEMKLGAIFKNDKFKEQYDITLVIVKGNNHLTEINKILIKQNIDVLKLKIENNDGDKNTLIYSFKVKAPNTVKYLDIIESIHGLEFVHNVQIEN
jgi:putative Mg2+ transporter-C (MgtC) family protein